MNLPHLDLESLIPAIKTGGATVIGAITYIVAQIQLPELGDVGNFGLVAVLAVLIGRYTFNQLEAYRSDLADYRSRIDTLEDDLHALGKSKAKAESRSRELEAYAHRLRIWAVAAGLDEGEIPPPPTVHS